VKTLLILLALACPATAQEDGTARIGLIRPGGILLFFDSVGPMSYVAMTPKDLPADAIPAGEVFGKGCQHSVNIPLGSPLSRSSQSISAAGGRGGYEKALKTLREGFPGLRGIYDVKIDEHTISILGFYRRVCAEITARGFR
jgi:hypothetical protein